MREDLGNSKIGLRNLAIRASVHRRWNAAFSLLLINARTLDISKIHPLYRGTISFILQERRGFFQVGDEEGGLFVAGFVVRSAED